MISHASNGMYTYCGKYIHGISVIHIETRILKVTCLKCQANSDFQEEVEKVKKEHRSFHEHIKC